MNEYIGGVRYQAPYAPPGIGRGDDWREQSACRGADPRLFDVTEQPEKAVAALLRYAVARSYCRTCPVRLKCIDDAVSSRASGIQGGEMFDRGRVVRDPARGGQKKRAAA